MDIRIPLFGFRKIRDILTNLNSTLAKANQTVHGSAEAATRTTEAVKSSVSGWMTAKGVKDCVVSYQCNDYICLTVSGVGTVFDVSNMVCGNVPGLKRFTPYCNFASVGCKSFVQLCRSGNITFSCNDLE